MITKRSLVITKFSLVITVVITGDTGSSGNKVGIEVGMRSHLIPTCRKIAEISTHFRLMSIASTFVLL